MGGSGTAPLILNSGIQCVCVCVCGGLISRDGQFTPGQRTHSI